MPTIKPVVIECWVAHNPESARCDECGQRLAQPITRGLLTSDYPVMRGADPWPGWHQAFDHDEPIGRAEYVSPEGLFWSMVVHAIGKPRRARITVEFLEDE